MAVEVEDASKKNSENDDTHPKPNGTHVYKYNGNGNGNNADNATSSPTRDSIMTLANPQADSTEDRPSNEPAQDDGEKENGADSVFQINIQLPHQPYQIPMMVSTQEQVQDLRQSIVEQPDTFQYSCFHLEHQGERINDYVELSEVPGLVAGAEIRLVEDPYTEKEARVHVLRVRDLIGAAGDRVDPLLGPGAGESLHDVVAAGLDVSGSVNSTSIDTTGDSAGALANSASATNPVARYDFDAPANIQTIIPPRGEPPPKTVKSLALSPWNPPPAHLRQRGHLLYLLLTTNEGEQFPITADVSGFYVNRSSNTKFDPFPRPSPKNASAHSLVTLLGKLSPSFDANFRALQLANGRKDPLANFQITHAIPAHPWLVSPADCSLTAHQPDLSRTQEAFLAGGVDNGETLRDWNEEFQSTRELPRDTVPDRLFRERLTAKLFADYSEAAVKGAMMVARGELAPLNPTEQPAAQIFVYNNVFFSFGADGVGIFAREGGDEAARIAVGRDVSGVRIVNQLDLEGLFTPGTVVVDYLGRRIVCQSIVPGIFKQREPGDNQVEYGGVEGRDVIAASEAFVASFAKLSAALRVKKHPVWDREGQRFDLEGSVETKGLLGTDGRKYALDLYRLTPPDIAWIEEHWTDAADFSDLANPHSAHTNGDSSAKVDGQISDKKTDQNESANKSSKSDYPHRMSTLRSELVEAFWRSKVTAYVTREMEKRKEANTNPTEATSAAPNGDAESGNENTNVQPLPAKNESTETTSKSKDAHITANGDDTQAGKDDAANSEPPAEAKPGLPKKLEGIDLTNFSFALNPDVYGGQVPPTAEDRAALQQDEQDVREAGNYLRQTLVPDMLRDVREGDVGLPMDGQSLTRLMHKRGINMRYLGLIAETAHRQNPRLDALHNLAVQEMIVRAFKHVLRRHLQTLPPVFAISCIAHLLNCMLGARLNESPSAIVDADLRTLYATGPYIFENVTPSSLHGHIAEQVRLRYRYSLPVEWVSQMKHLQILRDICLTNGIQLRAKDYLFAPAAAKTGSPSPDGAAAPTTNGHHASGKGEVQSPSVNGNGGKLEVRTPTTPGTNHGGKKKKKHLMDVEQSSASQESLVPREPLTFEPDDIVNLVPIIKEAYPRSALAEEALEAGKLSVAQDQKELGMELLLESLSLHEQIYGILHPEVARVYHQLAMVYYQLQEKAAAVELARKAVIVSERTIGIDANETVLSYLNLGFFEHAAGQTAQALRYVRHALELWKLIYGSGHPDSITTLNNAAVMLQHLRQFRDSRRWFEKALTVCGTVAGSSSVAAATLLFQLAQAQALDQDASKAVTTMREAYGIFRTHLGAEDRNTREAEGWLEQLTQNAVHQAKHAREVQHRRFQRLPLSSNIGGSSALASQTLALGLRSLNARNDGVASLPGVLTPAETRTDKNSLQGAAAAAAANVSGSRDDGLIGRNRAGSRGTTDSRSLDELIRFIEGSASTTSEGSGRTSSAKKRSGHAHPKRRGGRVGTVASS